MKLITETPIKDYEIIYEQKNANEPRFIKTRGPYIVAEKKNANGRVYSRKLMESAVKTFDESYIQPGRAFGELNHPQSASINYERACHRITSLKQEDNTWIGESIILCSNPQHGIHGTPLGEVLASVIQHGGKPGMSTRGVGSINEDGSVDKEFVLVTVDLVSDPSGPGCFVAGILESKEFVINTHGEIYEVRYNEFEKGIAKIPSGSSTTSVGSEHIKNLIESFLNDFGK